MHVSLVAFLGMIPAWVFCAPMEPDSSTTNEEAGWECVASAYGYLIPDQDFFVLPVVTVDRGPLHLEARYNYEDLRTGSLFAGWNFSFGSELTTVITPMAGVALGRTNGLVPGLEVAMGYGIVELSMEAEYLIDLQDDGSNFFYAWSELVVSPTEWLYAGLAGQRLRITGEDLEISRGIIVGAGWEQISGSVYFFEPGGEGAFCVVGLEWIF